MGEYQSLLKIAKQNMKPLAIAVIGTLVILGGITLTSKPVEYVSTEVVEIEKEVDALEQAIKQAQDAKRADIETSARKAYDDAYTQEMKKVELEVVRQFNEQLKARQVELEKETKTY